MVSRGWVADSQGRLWFWTGSRFSGLWRPREDVPVDQILDISTPTIPAVPEGVDTATAVIDVPEAPALLSGIADEPADTPQPEPKVGEADTVVLPVTPPVSVTMSPTLPTPKPAKPARSLPFSVSKLVAAAAQWWATVWGWVTRKKGALLAGLVVVVVLCGGGFGVAAITGNHSAKPSQSVSPSPSASVNAAKDKSVKIVAEEKTATLPVVSTTLPNLNVTVTGSGFPAGQKYSVTVGQLPVHEVTTDKSGGFSWALTLPGDVAPGDYPISVVRTLLPGESPAKPGDTTTTVKTGTLTVVAAPAAAPPAQTTVPKTQTPKKNTKKQTVTPKETTTPQTGQPYVPPVVNPPQPYICPPTGGWCG